MHRTAIDEHDGAPTWAIPDGSDLVRGVAAVNRLAVGVRCETWLGWSRELWCPVVVKLARPHQISRARRALARESGALAGNLHPALPRLFGAAVDAEMPHVVEEFVDGPALDTLVEDDGPIDVSSAALITIELLGGVLALHRRGLVHLDVKPENVVLRDGRPMLVDFGSTRPVGRRQPAGSPVGTLGFAAPEMEDCQPISTTMDVFGVGATVLAALAGDASADGRTPTTAAAVRANPTIGDTAGGRGLLELLGSMTGAAPADRPVVIDALDAVADLFDPDCRPWPAGVSLIEALWD